MRGAWESDSSGEGGGEDFFPSRDQTPFGHAMRRETLFPMAGVEQAGRGHGGRGGAFLPI